MDIPIELQAVFRRYSDAKAKFEGYSASQQREYVGYITEAKQTETRQRRADRVVMMLTGRKLNSVYQPKTIPEVFGLKPDMTMRVVNPPKDYSKIMSNWQFGKNETKQPLDFAHLFVNTQAELIKWLPKLKDQLKQNGMIWVSWPKKSSSVSSDVTENIIRDLAVDTDLVDIKVCAVSDVWSGLKLVIPKAKRR